MVEDACEALGAVHADGTTVGARGNLSVFGFYPNKQLTTGEGGAVVCPSAEAKVRIDSERNQGRAPDMGWLDHDRLGFNYRLDDLSCALGIAQLERLDELLAERERVAGLYAEGLAGVEGLELPCADAGGDRRSWFVYVVQLPPGVDRDAAVLALRERGVDSKPYLPAIHLYSFYRERFGHREGEFPVCEDVARRSLALPFFPGLTDAEVGARDGRRACRGYGVVAARYPRMARDRDAAALRLWSIAIFAARARARRWRSGTAPIVAMAPTTSSSISATSSRAGAATG